MRAAAVAAAVVAAFVGVMYLRFASDTVPKPPTAAPGGGPQCVIFRNVGDDASPQATCGVISSVETPLAFQPPSPVVLSTPNPQPSVPAFLSGMKIVPLEVGAPMDLPRDIALIVETGCWGCEGGPSGLVRVYMRPDGSVAYDSLFNPGNLSLPMLHYTAPDGSTQEYPPFITGYAITPDGSEILASLCLNGTCAAEGLSSWSADSRTVLFRSQDSGLHYWQGNVDVLASGDLVLRDDHGVPVRSDGNPLLSIPPGEEASVADFLIDRTGLDGLAVVYSASPGSSGTYYLMPFDIAGGIGRGRFAVAGDDVIWSTGYYVWLGLDSTGDGFILGNASVSTTQIAPNGQPLITDFVPVALDLRQGTMRPLRPFFEGAVPPSRNLIAAVQRGPFARVVNTGSCLNVRREPQLDGRVIDCFSDGVLLRDISHGLLYADEWVQVVVPGGEVGWANVQYLER